MYSCRIAYNMYQYGCIHVIVKFFIMYFSETTHLSLHDDQNWLNYEVYNVSAAANCYTGKHDKK